MLSEESYRSIPPIASNATEEIQSTNHREGIDAAIEIAAKFCAFLKDHYKWLSLVSFLLSSGLGIAVLFAYLVHIGRPDVFLRSLELGPALIVWMVLFFLCFMSLIVSTLASSYFYAVSILLIDSKDESLAKVALVVLFVVAGLMAMFVLLLAIGVYWRDVVLVKAKWFGVLVIYPLACAAAYFVRRKYSRVPKNKLSCVFNVALFGAALSTTTLVGVLPIYVVVKAYSWVVDEVDTLFVLLLGWLAMVLSMGPAYIYHWTKRESIGARFVAVLSSVVVYGMLIIPVAFGVSIVNIANWAGLSDLTPRYYQVSMDEYEMSEFLGNGWGGRYLSSTRFGIEAISLFEFGSVHLLCPVNAKPLRSSEWSQRSSRCVPFRRGAVSALMAAPKTY